MPVRAITFDADDTLWDFSSVATTATEAVVSELRSTHPEVDWTTAGLIAARRTVGDVSPPGTPFPEIRRRAIGLFVSTHLGDQPQLVDRLTNFFFDYRRNHVRTFDDVVPMLDALDGAVVVGVVTNGNMEWHSAAIADRIDFWLAADQTGIRKPDPRVFHMAAAAAGCHMRDLVHVGDEVGSDIVGAARAGARAVLVDRSGDADPGSADAVISGLDELPALVAGWDSGEVAGVGVGPHPVPWPDDPRFDPDLLAHGDRRNVADRFRYWSRDAIVEELDRSRYPFHVAVENWQHDLNIGTVVRTANAFGAAAVHIVGHRRWNRRGAMVTDRYQHVHHHETVAELAAWASAEGLGVVAVDNLPGAEPIETADLPERCVLLFGQEGSGLTGNARAVAGRVLSIAQFGSTRSINAGVAAGIAMHAWVRQHA